MIDSRFRQCKPTVIVVGPPPDMVGGMASVVKQFLSLDFGSDLHVTAFPTTFSRDARESRGARIVRHLRHLRLLASACRRARPGVVHVHTCSGASLYRSAADVMVARLAGCRTVLHVHGAAFDKFHADSGVVQRRLIERSLTVADRVVALSEGWRQKLRRMAPGARIVVVENAVALPEIAQSKRVEGPCRLLFLSRMDDWKGVDDLLDAAAHARAGGCEFELVLAGPAGSAGDAAVLNEKINARGLESCVYFAGAVYGAEKSTLLRNADLCVQPSHHEGLPVAVLEALSYGIPVIATSVGAIPEVITDRREGLLVPARRPDVLAEAICGLTRDPAARRAMGAAGRRLAESRFGLARLREDLRSLYRELLDLPPAHEACVRLSRPPGPGSSGSVTKSAGF